MHFETKKVAQMVICKEVGVGGGGYSPPILHQGGSIFAKPKNPHKFYKNQWLDIILYASDNNHTIIIHNKQNASMLEHTKYYHHLILINTNLHLATINPPDITRASNTINQKDVP